MNRYKQKVLVGSYDLNSPYKDRAVRCAVGFYPASKIMEKLRFNKRRVFKVQGRRYCRNGRLYDPNFRLFMKNKETGNEPDNNRKT